MLSTEEEGHIQALHDAVNKIMKFSWLPAMSFPITYFLFSITQGPQKSPTHFQQCPLCPSDKFPQLMAYKLIFAHCPKRTKGLLGHIKDLHSLFAANHFMIKSSLLAVIGE